MDSDEKDFYDDDSGDWAEEEDIGNEEPNYSAAGSRRKHYKVLKPEEIKQLQENDISTVSGVLSVSRGVACTLLYQNNWCPTSVYENWFAAEERNMAAAAVEPQSGKQICKICYRKTRPQKMVSTTCGHPFCANCWKKYIATAINAGVGCLTLRCPEPYCKATAGIDTVDMLASEDEKAKYYLYLRQSYVERNRKRKWCPSPGCDYAIEFDQHTSESDVACDCSFKFCWSCAVENHRPVDCKTVAEWMKKNSSEAENTNWILTYTKPCPKCSVPIEKNQGCSYMKCGAPCEFNFCWVCLGPWEGHGLYACNKFKGGEVDESRENAKKYLERYTHYYERWCSNEKSRRMAVDDLDRAKRRCDGRVKCLGQDDGRVKCLGQDKLAALDSVVEAWEQIVECRRVLKWSYAYGYYLSLEARSSGKMRLFECLQGQAEAELERLHHYVEKEVVIKDDGDDQGTVADFKEYSRMNLAHLTSVTRKYFENLVVALENNLSEVEVEVAAESCGGENSESSEKRRKLKK